MPKLWNDTIEQHRREVREAVLDAAAGLVSAHGPLSVTMTRIADETGIGRATLYKYFPDVESILVAWHDRQVQRHLQHLVAVRDGAGDPYDQLEAVLAAYARICGERGVHEDGGLAAAWHRGDRVAAAERQLLVLVRDLVAEAAKEGSIRADVPAEELARYSLHALAAAKELGSKAAVHRLVDVTLDGLRS